MTKNEYLTKLSVELKKNNIVDSIDIISEYEQHFAFKLADGFTEEEIAAKLGDPAQLATQFEESTENKKHNGRKIVTVFGLSFADLFAGIFFILLIAWEVVMGAFLLSCAALSVCLFANINIYNLVPPMPYWCAVILAVAVMALAILTAVGCIYFAALIRQLSRCYGRFHHNMLAGTTGNVTLPSLSIRPQFSAKVNRRLRSIALFTLIVFAVFFILGIIVSMISSGALEFWHEWNWFVN